MAIKTWFPTSVYTDQLSRFPLLRFNEELAEECRSLRDYDDAGRQWSEKNYPGGYTSYATINQLHKFSSTFEQLEKKITRHVKKFAADLEMDLRGRTITMTDFWVNIMPEHSAHSLHLHPLSFISGTYYVVTPPNCAGLKFEDPRLSRFMAAPPKRANARPENQTHIVYPAKAGNLILFESWLRHEVAANRTPEERISVSFNYNWS
jgi:uncharacterized protein (TIGR02466 family)